MLLQSHTGIVRVFPAIPAGWENVSFKNLRAMGAFLVSAEKKNGQVINIRVFSEQGGLLRIASPVDGKILEYKTTKGKWIDIPTK